jgi:hypothetical protein
MSHSFSSRWAICRNSVLFVNFCSHLTKHSPPEILHILLTAASP